MSIKIILLEIELKIKLIKELIQGFHIQKINPNLIKEIKNQIQGLNKSIADFCYKNSYFIFTNKIVPDKEIENPRIIQLKVFPDLDSLYNLSFTNLEDSVIVLKPNNKDIENISTILKSLNVSDTSKSKIELYSESEIYTIFPIKVNTDYNDIIIVNEEEFILIEDSKNEFDPRYFFYNRISFFEDYFFENLPVKDIFLSKDSKNIKKAIYFKKGSF